MHLELYFTLVECCAPVPTVSKPSVYRLNVYEREIFRRKKYPFFPLSLRQTSTIKISYVLIIS